MIFGAIVMGLLAVLATAQRLPWIIVPIWALVLVLPYRLLGTRRTRIGAIVGAITLAVAMSLLVGLGCLDAPLFRPIMGPPVGGGGARF